MSVCVSPLVQATALMTENNLSCPQCPKSFSSTKLLQQHQQMFHTDKAFICETCGKAFRFRSNLAEHRSVHTALKPYVCKFCGKSSRLKGNLTKHILKHHKKEQNDAIGKDDIIVKKAPKPFKENGNNGTNGTTNGSTAASTGAAVISSSPSTTNASNNNQNNNNSNHVANNNHRNIKMEIEDPDYMTMAVPKTTTITAKVVNSVPSTPRKGAAPKEHYPATPSTPAFVASSVADFDTSLLPKDDTSENERFRNVLISLGFDYGSTLSLTRAQLQKVARELKTDMSVSPDTVNSESDPDYVIDSPPDANSHNNTVGGEATLAALIAAATSNGRHGDGSPDSIDTQKGESPSREHSPNSDPSSGDSCASTPELTQCTECGKHVRKSSHLPIHMTLSHGFPPPPQEVVEEKQNDEMLISQEEHLQNELRTIANAIGELKAQQVSTPRVEQALTYIDTRVGRLEKSLETALNSIYTLVQLQTGMTSSVNRLREDSQRNFTEMKLRMDRSCSPRRLSRRDLSVRSFSDSREDRSRSPL